MALASAVKAPTTSAGSRASAQKARGKTSRTTNVWMRNGDESSVHGRLTSRRVQLGLDQIDIANRMGVARAAYSQYETGKVVPSLEKIEKAAEALETTPQWIAFGGSNHEIKIMSYVTGSRTWVDTGETWPIPASWLKSKFPNLNPHSLDAFEATTDSPSAMVQKGDILIVARDQKPNNKLYQEFVFSMNGECHTDNVRKVEGGFLIGSGDEGNPPVQVSHHAIRILGQVVTIVAAA
ncbi:putative HTH DNA binding protein [Caulobacter phage C1]|nr:putative HTH DNA binding protein [Caulobacter phage C1]UTU08428.1 putative HTH DNA binding protein [Caulobacter phage C2]UTU09501.1 putative HTH DNA binding protein [Caulobacter phage BL47]UTU10061.1 putative HTH DNA binding protein [Caulobacter phage RB23]WGN97096.1 putative HTH DNA binding protein [Bertelyvirus sp.]